MNRTELIALMAASLAGSITSYTCADYSSCPGGVCTLTLTRSAGVTEFFHRWSDMPYGALTCAESTVYATTDGRHGYVAIP